MKRDVVSLMILTFVVGVAVTFVAALFTFTPTEKPAHASVIPEAPGIDLFYAHVKGIPCVVASNGGSGAIALSCEW